MNRTARVERTTKESSVLVEVDLDGAGKIDIGTGIGFFDHMLGSFGTHAAFDRAGFRKLKVRLVIGTP